MAQEDSSTFNNENTSSNTNKAIKMKKKSESSSAWPKEASSRALFYYSPPNTSNTNDETSPTCRLSYDEETSTIRILSYSEFGDTESDTIDPKEEEVVLDWLNPKDVIGAKLEFDFSNTTEESLNADLKKRLEKTALPEDKGEDEDGEERKRSSPAATPLCGLSASLSEMLSKEMEGFAFAHNSGCTATLNIYCYPRLRPEEMDTSWFSSSDSTYKMLPLPKANEEENVEKWGERRALHRTLEVAPCGDFSDVLAVVRAIRRVAKLDHYGSTDDNDDDDNEEKISVMKQRRKNRQKLLGNETKTNNGPAKYLVIINPFAGTKLATSIYENVTKKMFEECGVEHDVLKTTHAGHAMERMMQQHSKNENDEAPTNEEKEEEEELAKDVLEYDGIIAMGGDGILAEILQGIKGRSDAKDVLSNVPLGVIGCGTSNGLAKSFLYTSKEKCNPLESTFFICKGQTTPFDLSEHTLISNPNKSYYGFLHFCWALIADCDLESEVLRCLGSLRTDIWSVWRIISLRTYRARFSYLPPPPSDGKDDEVVYPAPTEKVPSNWKTIEDDFIVVWCNQGTHCEENMLSSPMSSMQDGLFQVILVRASCSRYKLIKMFLTIENGGHVDSDACEVYRCVAYRLEPLVKGSYNDLDGEKLEDGPIQARVLPSAAHSFY